MYSVKVELDKNNVCFGCLSSDRQLTLLKNHMALFYKLLEHQQVCNTKILLCWECSAILDKIWTFQKRIQRAQFILQQTFVSMHESWEKLSTLSTTRKDSYDHMLWYDEKSQQCDKESVYEVPLELPDIIEENVNNENTDMNVKEELDDIFDDFKLENDNSTDVENENANYETLEDIMKNDDNKSNDEEFDEDYKPCEKKPALKSIYERYMDKVTIIDADEDDFKQYCVRVTLNEKEIDELLDKEQSELRQGMRHDLPHKCKDCNKAYRKEVDYKRHIVFNHMNRTNRYLVCKQCKKSFSSWPLMEEHWAQYHNKYYRCTICGFTVQRSSCVVMHITNAHVKRYQCNVCNEQLGTMKEFRGHYREKHERLICDDCGKSFVKKRSLETHYKRHHLPPTCEVCNKTYSTYHNLDNHYRLNHPEFINCENRQELAYCVECNKQFPSVYKYRRHLTNAAVHTPPKVEIVPCPECGKIFSRKIRMTNHVMSVHRKNTKHRCDICNKTFCSAYSAKTHMKCVHEKVQMPKNKLCDICGRGFSTNRILANHRRTHTGERPYPCPHCPASFAQRVAMRTHAKTQHKNLLHDNQLNDNGITS